MSEGYISLRTEAMAQIERMKSKFLGIAGPAQTLEEAEARIEAARTDYPDATHHCYAYRVGLEGSLVRFFDDGEPGGTAGRPILDVIERHGLENVCIVVVRYYGGTPLGAAGLTRTYRAAAAAVVEKAGIARFERHTTFEGNVSYADWGRIERLLHQRGITGLQVDYQETVRFRASIITQQFDGLQRAVADESAGEVELVAQGTTFAATS